MLRVRDFLSDQRVIRAAGAPTEPAVSVVLPTYSRLESGSLAKAVASVLTQSFGDLELIVVDDGSRDGSFDYLREVQRRDPRLVLVRHDRNAGLPALRVNEGIELSRAEWIAFQFDDDLWLPDALSHLLAGASEEKEPVLAFGAAEWEFPSGERRIPLPPVAMNEALLSFQNRVCNNTVLVPRVAFQQVGLYDCHVAMRRLCDWDLWLRLIRHIRFVPVEAVVSRVRDRADEKTIGSTVPWDLALFRFWSAVDRRAALSPNRWHDYAIDSAGPVGLALPKTMSKRVMEQQIGPFRARHLEHTPTCATEPPERRPPRPRALLLAGDAYYAPWIYFMSRFDAKSATRDGGFKSYYSPLVQLEGGWTQEADVLLLVRSTTQPGVEALSRGRSAGVGVGYFIDDDLLRLHEQDQCWARLAPGSADREAFLEQLREADAVWVTNRYLADEIQTINPRVVPHNATIDEDMLPAELRPRPDGEEVCIGYIGGSYRESEFTLLWPALAKLARDFVGRIRFEFWGFDPGAAGLTALTAPVTVRPFEVSFTRFAEQLRTSGFDILLTPLLSEPAPRRAKTPSKYQLAAVAGALGIFSEVGPYASLPAGLSCLKARNEVEAWTAALREALTMPAGRFDQMRRAMIEHVRLELTTEAQLDLHEAACRAVEFHAHTRQRRGSSGRPRVQLAGARHVRPERVTGLARLLAAYGVEVDAEEPTPDGLSERPPAVVHAFGDVERTALLCRERGVALVADSCLSESRALPAELFRSGALRLAAAAAGRDGQDGARQNSAGGILHVVSDEEARDEADREWLRGLVAEGGGELISGSGDDGLACASVRGALVEGAALGDVSPTEWATAAALPVVLCRAGAGRDELRLRVEELFARIEAGGGARCRAVDAYRAVRGRLHPSAVANRLLAAYLVAVDSVPQRPRDSAESGGARRMVPEVEAPPAAPVQTGGASRVDALRHRADRIGIYRPLSRVLWRTRRKRVLVSYDNSPLSTELYFGLALPELEEATGRKWVVRAADQVGLADLYSYHAVILQRALSATSVALLRAAKAEGCLTVYDADDNFDLIDAVITDPESPWREYYRKAHGRVVELLGGVDWIKVYSSSAVPLFRRRNPNVVAIRPFHHDVAETPQAASPQGVSASPVRVGFLGSEHKDADFEPVMGPLRELLGGGHPIALEFFGFCPRALADDNRVTRIPWESDYRRFREQLLARRWDIGLAPLRDLDFNRCKSNVKYREYAAAGIAGVYADVDVYKATVVHGRTGLLVTQGDPAAWLRAIRLLCAEPGLRAAIAQAANADLRANYTKARYAGAVAELLARPRGRLRRAAEEDPPRPTALQRESGG